MKKLLITPQNKDGLFVSLTEEEINEIEKNKQFALLVQQKNEAEKTAKTTGNQKLLDLGLSQEEATALTGYIPTTDLIE